MATVVLQYAGAALGTLLGGPIGGIIGRAAGAIAGNIIDQKLFGPGTRRSEGPRLNDLRVMTSEEGAPIPRLWGRMRIAGQVIWATSFEEVATTDTKSASGKGGGSKSKTTTYSYFANFAVGLCEGEVARIGRVWADGKLIDLATFTTRFHPGSETQQPDSLIIAKQGQGNAPAYRGLAYIVFERMPLENFGNRIPQLSFEVMGKAGGAAPQVRAVNIIPGSSEFAYDTTIVTRREGGAATISENAHASALHSDWAESLDSLQAECTNAASAALVVAWFGNDLRCGQCQLQPRVEATAKLTEPYSWNVAGLGRAVAQPVSLIDGKPAFGGTPSDASVVRAIQDLRTRGLKPVFYPFILMDIASGNGLPDPYGGAQQAAYPWRGRITAAIAPGRPGSPDKTAAAAAQLSSFTGSAQPSHFAISGTTVSYSGPPEWSYRRMILHYAKLCAAAGGVDAFIIGSELRGLTTLRSSASAYPFVAALASLAADVKSILPSAKVTYAADWSEYFGHQPADGSHDVHFHLDPLWASPSIDAIGIDNYMPLSDWRDGSAHLDALAGHASIYDEDYLRANIAGGEGHDWFYASAADRDLQVRTPVTDGAYGKPWVFRPKDLKGWWSNLHYNRPGGTEQPTPTAFVPQSKPIWFTELGFPAVDKGANQPNVFVDPKSSESALPYYSNGSRDDTLQASCIKAVDAYWSSAGPHNPVSPLYGAPMVDAKRIYLWCWDARPFPYFPALTTIWSDGANHARGHWLNGRLSAVPLRQLVRDICAASGLADIAFEGVHEAVEGFIIDRPMSGREALENLLAAFAIDAVESGGTLRFISRRTQAFTPLGRDDLVDLDARQPLKLLTRAQQADLPGSLKLVYADASTDYRSAVAAARRQVGGSSRETVLSLPCATTQQTAAMRAEVLLQESWLTREMLSFSLPPSQLALEPGDVLRIDGRRWRLASCHHGSAMKFSAELYEPGLFAPPAAPGRLDQVPPAVIYGKPSARIMDLAIAIGANPSAPWLAACATPWPGALALLRQSGEQSFALRGLIEAQATMGTVLTPVPAGRLHLFDHATTIDVRLDAGALASVSELEVLNGANVAVIGDAGTGYEIIQFASAEFLGSATFRLRTLLRGQGGSAAEMQPLRPAGAGFVLLNAAVRQPDSSLPEQLAPSLWRIGPAQLDHGHPAYLQLAAPGGGKALRPLSPSRLSARRDNGDLMISWIRRTRIDGDAWELAEVPLGEQSEAYRIAIHDGAAVKRSADTTVPTYRYSAAAMAADFAVPPASLTISVRQLSASYGAGAPTWGTFDV